MRKRDLERALIKQADPAMNRAQRHERRLAYSRSGLVQKLEDTNKKADELRRRYDPALLETEWKYSVARGQQTILVCPVCGTPDRGNRKNGKPYCPECNKLLVYKDSKGGNPVVRQVSRREAIREEIRKVNPGLHPQ